MMFLLLNGVFCTDGGPTHASNYISLSLYIYISYKTVIYFSNYFVHCLVLYFISGKGWTKYNGHCYYYDVNLVTWETAKVYIAYSIAIPI